jgi:thiol-disulfide isomerase/thioredoxin
MARNSSRSETRSLVGAIVVAVLLTSACGRDAPGQAGDAADGGYSVSDESIVLVAPADRHAAPDISGTTLEGEAWSLASYRGNVVVINVWASWCAPCRAEAPALKAVSEDLADEGVVFVGLNTRDSDTSALAFEKSFGITYPSVIDTDGQLQLLFAADVNPSAIPSTIVIDRQGRVAGRILGRASESTLRAVVEPLVAEGITRAPESTLSDASKAPPEDD